MTYSEMMYLGFSIRMGDMLCYKAANKLIGTFYTLRGISLTMENQGSMVSMATLLQGNLLAQGYHY